MKKTLLSVLVLLGLAAVANGKAEKEWIKLYEPHVYKDMPYRLLEPLNFKPKERYPVIVSLHSFGGRGSDNLRQLNTGLEILTEEQNRKDYPCYILAPQMQESWDLQHLKAVKEIIDDLPSASVDRRRIYVMGHSKGGFGTYLFIEADPTYFAAAVPLAGSGSVGRREIDASKIKDVPIWAFHGDQDTKCPIEKDQKLFAKMQKIGGNMKFTIWVGDGHPVAPQMITGADNGIIQFSSDRCDPEPDFLKWLFAQKLPLY
jgi:predicted peptidase